MRSTAKARHDRGVEWPLIASCLLSKSNKDNSKKKISTTKTSKAALIHGYLALKEATNSMEEADAAIKSLNDETEWRQNYATHFLKHVKICAEAKPRDALKMASGGLQYLHTTFQFIRNGQAYSLSTPMSEIPRDPRRDLKSREINNDESTSHKNNNKRSWRDRGHQELQLRIPMGNNKYLKDKSLEERLQYWSKVGIIEDSAADALRFSIKFINAGKDDGRKENLKKNYRGEEEEEDHKYTSWQAKKDSHAFVVLGAGAAIGPTKQLLLLGATVVAVDLNNKPKMWKNLISFARKTPGKLIVPERGMMMTTSAHEGGGGESYHDRRQNSYARYGANLLTDIPEIAHWLAHSVCPGMDLTLGSYAYLDGKDFVRIVLAMDAICNHVLTHRKSSRVNLAFLASPSDIYLRSRKSRDMSVKRYKDRETWVKVIEKVSAGAYCKPNITGPLIQDKEFDVVDASVPQQGPNYLLAKRIQQWRAIVARSKGIRVSINIAPASATESVTKNPVLRAAYAGVSFFPPTEVFHPTTTNSVMAAALIRDIFDEDSPSNPSKKLEHPLLLISEGAWHGGLWTTAVSNKSSAVVSAGLGFVKEKSQYLKLGAALGTGYLLMRKIKSKL